jgi:hypothetical protein
MRVYDRPPLVPGEARVDAAKRLDLDLRRAPDAARRTHSVDDDDEVTNRRERLASVLVVAPQGGGRTLDAGYDKSGELAGHFRVVAE